VHASASLAGFLDDTVFVPANTSPAHEQPVSGWGSPQDDIQLLSEQQPWDAPNAASPLPDEIQIVREDIVLLVDVVGPSEEIQLLSDYELPDQIEVLLAPISPAHEQPVSGRGLPQDDIQPLSEQQPWGAPNAEQQPHDRKLMTEEEEQSATTEDLRDITSPVDDITVLLDDGSIERPPDAHNLVDKTGAKYTSRSRTSSLILKPAVGKTVVQGARFYAADDAEEHDPASFVIDGGVLINGTYAWTTFRAGKLNVPHPRIARTASLATDPPPPYDGVFFNNDEAYDAYRFTFPSTKGDDGDGHYEMQLAGIELLGYRTRRRLQKSDFNVYDLVSHTIYFWRYVGTLTVPPCKKDVQWRLYDSPLKISLQQEATLNWLLRAYRNPKTCRRETIGSPRRDGTRNVDVTRPIQEITYDHLLVHCTSRDF